MCAGSDKVLGGFSSPVSESVVATAMYCGSMINPRAMTIAVSAARNTIGGDLSGGTSDTSWEMIGTLENSGPISGMS